MSTPIFDPETGEIIQQQGGGDQQSPAPARSGPISLDEVRTMLAKKHGVVLGTDDPVLMLVTMHQAFLTDYDAMLADHDEKIRGFLGATGDACAKAVEAMMASLKDKTVKASLDQAFALVERQAVAMDALHRAIRRHRIFISITSGMTVISTVIAVWIFTLLAK